MTDTETFTSTGITTDTVRAAADNQPMMPHIVCRLCHPSPRFGTPALCGDSILNIPADGHEADTCPDCLDRSQYLLLDHFAGLHGKGK